MPYDKSHILDFTVDSIFNENFKDDIFESLVYKFFSWKEVTYTSDYKKAKRHEISIILFPRFSDVIHLFIDTQATDGSKKNQLMVKRFYDLHKEMKNNSRFTEIFSDDEYQELLSILGLKNWAHIKDISSLICL